MSRGERIRTLIFAILSTIASVVMVIGMVTTGEYRDTIVGLAIFGSIALFDWMKLLVDG